MGTIEEKLLGDISVIEMVGQLLPDLPQKLALRIRSRTGYFLDHREHGRLYGKPSGEAGELDLVTTSAATRPDADVRKEIVKKLGALGATEEKIRTTLATYDAAAPGDEVEVHDGWKVQKPVDVAGETFGRTHDEPLVPQVVPLGIAYLFAACFSPLNMPSGPLRPAPP
jgi:hypothetical protein